jgi:hypothetical protein
MSVPNNPLMRQQDLADPREAALDYMARIAFPAWYDQDGPTRGVPPAEFALLETFYDRGAEALQALMDAGALYLDTERGHPYPNYHADLPQDAAPLGRALAPAMPPGQALKAEQVVNPHLAEGSVLVEVLRQAAQARGAPTPAAPCSRADRGRLDSGGIAAVWIQDPLSCSYHAMVPIWLAVLPSGGMDEYGSLADPGPESPRPATRAEDGGVHRRE